MGLNLDVQDWKAKHFASEVLHKSAFAEVGILMIPECIFHDFGWHWDSFSCGSWHLWYLNLCFGMLGGFTLASWRTLGRSWDIGEHQKGHFEVQASVFVELLWIQGPNFESFLGTLENVYVAMIVTRLLFLIFFGSESGCSGLENYAFCKEVLQKSIFAEV